MKHAFQFNIRITRIKKPVPKMLGFRDKKHKFSLSFFLNHTQNASLVDNSSFKANSFFIPRNFYKFNSSILSLLCLGILYLISPLNSSLKIIIDKQFKGNHYFKCCHFQFEKSVSSY